VQTLLAAPVAITKIRGQWYDYRGIRMMPTFHPAYLLRNPPAKPDAWKDLQKVMAVLGLKPPKKKL
jgi:DNA polymerase